MPYEVFWMDLGSNPNFSGFEECSTVEMAVEFSRVRILFSSRDSFAIVSDKDIQKKSGMRDARLYKIHWEGSEIVVYGRDSADWNKSRVRSN